MILLNERFNDDIDMGSFIDEFDRYDEFDIDLISREYDLKSMPKNIVKDVDEIL